MDSDALEHEGAYFRRVESRLVALEFRVEQNTDRLDKVEPVVSELRDREMLAAEIARRVGAQRRVLVTKVTVVAALGAVFVPPVLTAALVKYGVP